MSGAPHETIQWTSDLATGSEEVDAQHKELFKRFDDLIGACKAGKAKQEVGKFLSFLESYVIFHFESEEQYMVTNAYPLYERHKARHEEFIGQICELRKQLNLEGPSFLVMIRTSHTAFEWLRTHVMDEDKEMGQYIRARKAPSE